MAGLGTVADAPTVARIFHAATGLDPDDLRIVGRGSTSIGWRVDCGAASYCVLVAIPRGARVTGAEPANYAARYAVLSALAAGAEPGTAAGQTAPPVAVDREAGWLIMAWVPGRPAGEKIESPIARQVGQLLRRLHALPTEGFGLLENSEGAIRGREPSNSAGLLARWWPGLWPFDGRPMIAHPLSGLAPELLSDVASVREPLLHLGGEPRAMALCHADLDGDHLRIDGERLGGVIDYGDAAVVPAAFDIALFASHFGWQSTEELLTGYAESLPEREVRLAEAELAAVALALQLIEKYHAAVPDEKQLGRALAFLRATIPLARGRRHDW